MTSQAADTPFARRMRELLKAQGLSYAQLAAKTFYNKSYLHGLATGRKVHPSPECAAAIDEALGAGGELVACATSRHERLAGPPVVSDTGDVLRRTMLTALAGLGIGQAVDQLGLSTLITTLADHASEARTVDDWQEAAWEYGYAYLTMTRTELLRDVTADLVQLQATMSTTPATSRPGLSEAAARLAGLMAMACTDLGYDREARHGWRLARSLSDASGSLDCRLWVRGQEATLGLYARRPAPVVLALADRALAIGEAPVGGRAELLAARAQTLMRLGRPVEAEAALGSVRDAFDALPEAVTSGAETIFGWPEQRLRHAESYVTARSSTTACAQRAHDAALALYPPSRSISRCQVELHRATRLVHDRHVGDGLSHASAALASLPAERRGRLVVAVGEQVLAAVPARETTRPEAVHLREQLAAATAATA